MTNWRPDDVSPASSENAVSLERSRKWLEGIPAAQRLAVWRLFEACLGYKAQADAGDGEEKKSDAGARNTNAA